MAQTIAVLFVLFSILTADLRPAAAEPVVHLWFSSSWSGKDAAAQQIADELGQKSGLKIVPSISVDNPEIMTAMSNTEPEMAFVGSMVAAVIWSRRLAQPLFQAMDGKHLYAGVMIFPKGQDPETILKDNPADIAYTIGATAGEVCAKAASGGRASQGVASFAAAADAVQSGKAKAAFVKDFWWDDNKRKYPGLDSALVPGISDSKNPDNVMLVSLLVAPEIRSLLFDAAYHAPRIFGANVIVPIDSSAFDFTIALMKKAGIDPLTYAWPR